MDMLGIEIDHFPGARLFEYLGTLDRMLVAEVHVDLIADVFIVLHVIGDEVAVYLG